jgi:hypothetical protein
MSSNMMLNSSMPAASLYCPARATYLRSRSWMYCTLAKYIAASTRHAAMPGNTCIHAKSKATRRQVSMSSKGC